MVIPGCYDSNILDWVVERARESESGARNIANIISDTLSPQIALVFLEYAVDGEKPKWLHASLSKKGEFQLKAGLGDHV